MSLEVDRISEREKHHKKHVLMELILCVREKCARPQRASSREWLSPCPAVSVGTPANCSSICLPTPRCCSEESTLPSDGDSSPGFGCGDLPYGMYADEANNCAVFHVCLPYIDGDTYITRHFSFLCGEGTMFDQERLICDFPENSIACSESVNYRKSNEYFGRDVNFLE
ncbi:uncharacterized protein LOC134767086 [Penaeus indicus]|uniref:uncharacterized protein LOC134767086 n=1 Tax=Penaeus indicus TaxID=29960 RepID=UPI00300D96FC